MRSERPRRLAWEGTLNARDLGGYPAGSSCQTRWGAFVRCDTLGSLSETGRKAVIDHGVRTVIDLRFPDELAADPDPFASEGDHGVRYHHISLLDPSSMPSTSGTLATNYVEVLERFKPQIAQVLTTIADVPEGVVLFHCMGGKDRTGTIAALLLGLAGVPREVIVEDYALTAEYLAPYDAEYLTRGPGTLQEREASLAWWRARAEVMDEVLTWMEQQHGSIEAYVRSCGVSERSIVRLRERLVEPVDEDVDGVG